MSMERAAQEVRFYLQQQGFPAEVVGRLTVEQIRLLLAMVDIQIQLKDDRLKD